MVKGYLCLHRCGLSDDQRAVVLGRTGGMFEIASIAPTLRSCFPEYQVPKLNRRSHRVFVSEMPVEEEEEEEEEIDEGASIDDLEDVEKFTKEDDESDDTLDEEGSPRVVGNSMETKTTRNFKRETSSMVWKTVEIDSEFCNEEIPRGSGRAETENEVQSMWTSGTIGERMSAKIFARSPSRWEKKTILEET